MLPDLGKRVISASIFHPKRQALIVATTVLGLVEQNDEDLKNQLCTNAEPITVALYNPLFNQVG